MLCLGWPVSKKKSDQGIRFRGRLTPAHAGRRNYYSFLDLPVKAKNAAEFLLFLRLIKNASRTDSKISGKKEARLQTVVF